MKFNAIASTLLGTSALVAAIPSPSRTLQARAGCTTISPDYARVDEAQPVASYLPGFIVGQDANGVNKKDAFAEFKVPDGSYGCQLEYYFPANYPISTTGGSPLPIYIYTTDGPLTHSPVGIDVSWSYSPQPVTHVGTVEFQSDPSQPKRVVINSFTCQPTLTYRFSVSSDYDLASSVSFTQSSSAGLRLTYNC